MLITIQFPITDLRPLINVQGRSKKPHWSPPKPEEEFVRNFGMVRKRRKGGLQGWVGEGETCEARRILRFDKNIVFSFPGNSKKSLSCAFRRLFFDNTAVAGKFEVGLGLSLTGRDKNSVVNVQELLETIFSSSVSIIMNKQRMQSKLITSGKKIAGAYLGATTRHGAGEPPAWWVHAGPPILFLEYQGENLVFPFETHLSLDKGDYQLSWGFVDFQGIKYTIWILRTNPEYHVPKGNYDPARCLRIVLLRLYAENQSLHHVIQSVNDQNVTDYGDRLQNYLRQSILEVVKFEKKYDLDANYEFIALSRLAFDQAMPGLRETTIQILEKIRPYVKEIIDEYMEREEKIMTNNIYHIKGDNSTIIVNSTIKDSEFKIRYDAHKEDIDLAKLAAELEILKKKILESGELPSQGQIIEKIDEAKDQAKNQNGGKALKALEAVGKVLLKIAETAGTTVVTAAINAAMGK